MIGLWPKSIKNNREKLICNLRTFIAFLAITIGFVIPSVYSLTKVYSDIILTLDNLIFTLPSITLIARIIIFWWNKEAVYPIMIMIAEDWIKLKNIQERKLMMKWAQATRMITTCAYGILGGASLFVAIIPRFGIRMRYVTNITDPNRLLPVENYYMYDINQRLYYEMTFISQIVAMLSSIMTYTGIDTLLGLLIFHICGQLDILKDRLIYLHNFKNYYAALRDSIMDHKRLLRAITIVEDTYNTILFVLFIYFGVLFTFYGFLIINFLEEGYNLSIAHLMYLSVAIVIVFGYTFLYCAAGELLMTHCHGIYYAVCKQNWYTFHPEDTRNLILLVLRSSKPVYLTAGKLFPMTISTFCSLIKTSTGYISVLLTIRT